jgi:hypothetical protein
MEQPVEMLLQELERFQEEDLQKVLEKVIDLLLVDGESEIPEDVLEEISVTGENIGETVEEITEFIQQTSPESKGGVSEEEEEGHKHTSIEHNLALQAVGTGGELASPARAQASRPHSSEGLEEEKEDLYEVEELLDYRRNGCQGYSLVKWRGGREKWGDQYKTWEVEENMIKCGKLLKKFYKRRLLKRKATDAGELVLELPQQPSLCKRKRKQEVKGMKEDMQLKKLRLHSDQLDQNPKQEENTKAKFVSYLGLVNAWKPWTEEEKGEEGETGMYESIFDPSNLLGLWNKNRVVLKKISSF